MACLAWPEFFTHAEASLGLPLVGTARCAVPAPNGRGTRVAYSREGNPPTGCSLRPLKRGRGRRSAASLPELKCEMFRLRGSLRSLSSLLFKPTGLSGFIG